MMQLEKADGKHMFMIGNDTIAFGAVAGGARLCQHTQSHLHQKYGILNKKPKVGGTVIKLRMKSQLVQWQSVQTMLVFVH